MADHKKPTRSTPPSYASDPSRREQYAHHRDFIVAGGFQGILDRTIPRPTATVLAEALPASVQLDDSETEILLGIVVDAIARYTLANREIERPRHRYSWTADDCSRLSKLTELPDHIITELDHLRSGEGNVRSGKSYAAAIVAVSELKRILLELYDDRPTVSPPHPPNYPLLLLCNGLAKCWSEVTERTIDRSVNKGSFSEFFRIVSESVGIDLPKGTLEGLVRQAAQARGIKAGRHD